MKISYTNTHEEMYDYHLKQTLNSKDFQDDTKRMKKVYFYLSLLVIAAGVVMILFSFGGETQETRLNLISRGASFVFMGLISMSFGWFYKLIKTFFLKRQLKKKDFGNEEVELNIDRKAINWTYKGNKGVIRQTEDIKVKETDETILVVTRKHTFIIPKRIFTEETLAEFKEAINFDKRTVKEA